MIEQTARKTFKYKLKPTLAQVCLLERTLLRCRHVYNAAVGERREAWRMCGVSLTPSTRRKKARNICCKTAWPL